jgi:hypothetical protein
MKTIHSAACISPTNGKPSCDCEGLTAKTSHWSENWLSGNTEMLCSFVTTAESEMYSSNPEASCTDDIPLLLKGKSNFKLV